MVIGMTPDDLERPAAGMEPAVAKGQRVGQIVEQGMPARLRFESERKGRVRLDVDRVDRIHLDRDGKSHTDLLGCRLVYHAANRRIAIPETTLKPPARAAANTR